MQREKIARIFVPHFACLLVSFLERHRLFIHQNFDGP